MPKAGINRDDFVARVQRRRRWARMRLRGRRLLIPDKRSLQEALYEATFRSDAEGVEYYYALRNDHLPDLDHPGWLDEKVRWQFLNHPNPLMSYAADKIAVRKYLRFKGAQIAPARLIVTGFNPEEIADADLPEAFVLKSNFGSGQNHIDMSVVRVFGTYELNEHRRALAHLVHVMLLCRDGSSGGFGWSVS